MITKICYFTELQDHVDMIAMSAETARMHYAEVPIYILSSKQLEVPEGIGLMRFPEAGRMPLMTANLWLQQQAIWMLNGSDLLFLDPDILLQGRLSNNMLPAELVITNRRPVDKLFQTQPYNFGVIGVQACQNTYDAWSWMVYRCNKLAGRYQKWYGNQVALRELCGPRVTSGLPYEADFGFFNLQILQLDGERYNYTPESLTEDLSDKVILHFKGERKDMMRERHKQVMEGYRDSTIRRI